MTYLSISEILAADAETIADYIRQLETEQEFPDAEFVINTLRATSTEFLPVPDGVFYSFTRYMANNSRNRYTIKQVSSNSLAVLWSNDSTPHVIFVGRTTHQRLLMEIKNLLDSGTDDVMALVNTLPSPRFTSVEARDYAISLDIYQLPLIPENSATLEMKEDTARFSGALWYEAIQKKVIILAGVGGIGSYVGFLLARMKPASMFIYDDDKVETVNMSGQLYSTKDIDKYKVDALAAMVGLYADYHSVFAVNQKFTEESEPSKIMICGFDSMQARRLFFSKWLELVRVLPDAEKGSCLYIDGRLAAEDLQVYCITGDNNRAIREYREECLFSDKEADETVCSYKQTTYMANMIGSIIVNLFTNFVANELVGAPIRELPFLTEYSGSTMNFKMR